MRLSLGHVRARIGAYLHEQREALKRLTFRGVLASIGGWFREQLGREAFSSLAHVAILLALITLLRPMFFRLVGAGHYQSPFILESMAKSDLTLITNAAKRHQPAISETLHFLVPAIIFFLAKRKLRWTDWEHGKALRVFVMIVLVMLAWSGTTFPHNFYLNRFHGMDRLALVLFTALSWRYPIFVPFAARWCIVMLKQAYIPIIQDDFDFRAPAELIVVFSIFVWASISKSFKPAHFLVAGLGSYGSYYFCAGIAKWNFGPKHSWLLENHVSNLSVATYVKGWLSFVPESAFLAFADQAAKLDRVMQGYTLLIEIGAILGFFLHRRLTRWWFLGTAVLNLGIFLMSGVFFWKWMTVGFAAFVWMGRGGKPLVERLHQYKLPLLLGIASIYYSNQRIWYFPQTHVVWYDTRLTEDYEIYVIGESGQRYLVRPSYFAPSDMHFTQGRLCYATDKERAAVGIYGTSGSINTLRQLEKFDRPEKGLAMQTRGRLCRDAKMQARFEDFMKRFFTNLNSRGPRREWINWIGRPNHLQTHSNGRLKAEDGGDLPLFDAQEKVVTLEMWLNVAYHHKNRLHRTEPKLVHTVNLVESRKAEGKNAEGRAADGRAPKSVPKPRASATSAPQPSASEPSTPEPSAPEPTGTEPSDHDD